MFHCKEFSIEEHPNIQKVGTDSLLLGSLIEISNENTPQKLLDIGTGNGILSLIAASKCQNLEVLAIDNQAEAIELANRNFVNSRFSNRIESELIDFETFYSTTHQTFDFMISNPPYFDEKTSEISPRQANRFSGNLNFSMLLMGVSKLLKSDGKFWVVIPFAQRVKFISEVINHQLFINQLYLVSPFEHETANLLILSIHKVSTQIEFNKIPIYDSVGIFSKKYKEITKAVYTKDL